MQHGSWSQPPSVFIIAGFSPCLKRLIPLHPGCQVCLNFSKLSPPLFSQHSRKKKSNYKNSCFFFSSSFSFFFFPSLHRASCALAPLSTLRRRIKSTSVAQNRISLLLLFCLLLFLVCVTFSWPFCPLLIFDLPVVCFSTSPFLFSTNIITGSVHSRSAPHHPPVWTENQTITYLKVPACHWLDSYVCIYACNYMCNTVRSLFTFCKPAINLQVGV